MTPSSERTEARSCARSDRVTSFASDRSLLSCAIARLRLLKQTNNLRAGRTTSIASAEMAAGKLQKLRRLISMAQFQTVTRLPGATPSWRRGLIVYWFPVTRCKQNATTEWLILGPGSAAPTRLGTQRVRGRIVLLHRVESAEQLEKNWAHGAEAQLKPPRQRRVHLHGNLGRRYDHHRPVSEERDGEQHL